jgi:hypothetical protein
MQRAHGRPMYTGYPAGRQHGGHGHHHGGGHGFCSGCGHPRSSCCCGCRECRKEARDLLVEPTTELRGAGDTGFAAAAAAIKALSSAANEAAAEGQADAIGIGQGKGGSGTAFIGGGCCVHLSVEYVPTGTANGTVMVVVKDSNDTELAWLKSASPGLGYQIKEGIITTKPGATMTVLVVGAIARVRWCEVFSCC